MRNCDMILFAEVEKMEKKRFTTYLSTDIINWLKHHSIEDGRSGAEIIETLLRQYKEKNEKNESDAFT